MENIFLKPERPFLLHYHIQHSDTSDDWGWSWFEDEDEMLEVINEMKENLGNKYLVEDIMEIGSIRDIKIE